MANTSYTQQALASEPSFHARVRAALATVAFQVIAEGRDNAAEIQRYNYATITVLPNLALTAVQISPWLVERTNLIGADTTYDFPSGAVVTAATDGAIESQIYTDWNVLAGVVT
jgi:hypothetical protein